MGYSLRYRAPTGAEYQLLEGSDGTPFIEVDTLSGFVGTYTDNPVVVPGEPGAALLLADRTVAPMEGSFTLVLFTFDQWVKAHADFSTRAPGTLLLRRDSGAEYQVAMQLAASLPAPGAVPRQGARIELSAVCYAGVWSRHYTAAGSSVSIANGGDVPIWPTLVWSGSGGTVRLPSGASFTLPAVTAEHRLPLRRSNSARVWVGDTRAAVTVDAVGEMIPVDETRLFGLPAGAHLEWEEGVLNPWI